MATGGFVRRAGFLLIIILAAPSPGLARDPDGDDDDAATLDRVQVVATRLRRVPAFDTPASLSIVQVDGRESGAGGLSGVLGGVPGLLVRDRQNHAQDMQISLRGFGARSTFGVRGLRLFADGIPATMPDGQGQVSHFALADAERIEVLRGPFSALYGNSSGGVIQMFSADGETPTRGQAQASSGGDVNRDLSASLRGIRGDLRYALSGEVFETDGWRDHAAARRRWFNVKLEHERPGSGRLRLVANHFGAPDAQDPLGLTWAQVRENPRQVSSAASLFDTRKSTEQNQIGLVYEQPLHRGHALHAMAYVGQRRVEQYLSVPMSAQANPLSAGGVVDLNGGYGGMDLRWSWHGSIAGRELDVTLGANADRQRQQRRGYENFAGSRLGVRGALRRDERNAAANVDQYAQAWWRFAPGWSLLAGVRHSRMRFDARDAYITALNPDDSGAVTYSETTPVGGVTFAPNDRFRVYLSASRGFETPTLGELGYRADGGAGLAFDLKPAVSRNVEIGGKWRDGRGAFLEAALFRADTDDELAVAPTWADAAATGTSDGRAARASSFRPVCLSETAGTWRSPTRGWTRGSATAFRSAPPRGAPTRRCWSMPAPASPAPRADNTMSAWAGDPAIGKPRWKRRASAA